jgi:hypothetical protein
MKVTRNLLVILLSLFLSVPVFAKGSHGGRSTSSQSHSSHASHVRIMGSYVQEKNHAKWMEIHPVSSISVLP